MASFFRYPGGKAKLKTSIITAIRRVGKGKPLVEVCAGAASISLAYLQIYGDGEDQRRLIFDAEDRRLWLNDIDPGIAAIWEAVASNPSKLEWYIRNFKPSLDEFRLFRKQLLNGGVDDVVEHAFKKIAIHQMSYSGLGLKAGGPIGGETQSSDYAIGCRWNSRTLCMRIDQVSRRLRHAEVKVTSQDFRQVLAASDGWVAYIDPPYYARGGDLYKWAFSDKDHEELAALLRGRRDWVLSYDDHERIRELYSWASIKEGQINYSITAKDGRGREGKELIICPTKQ